MCTVGDSLRTWVVQSQDSVEFELLPDRVGFTATVPVSDSPTDWVVKWSAPAETTFVRPVEPNSTRFSVFDTLSFRLTTNFPAMEPSPLADTLVVVDEPRLGRILTYTFVPGGSLLSRGRRTSGLLVAAGEVAAAGLWFYANSKRIDYLERARAATTQGALDRAFGKAQDYRRRQNHAAILFGGLFLLNMADSILNVKNRVGRNIRALRTEGWEFSQETREGKVIFRMTRAPK